jgi:hypothetical protein
MKTSTRLSTGLAILGLAIAWPGVGQAAETSSRGGNAAGAPAAAPAGQTDRFAIPWFTSQNELAGARSTVVVSILNNSGATCRASVRFQFGFSTSDACTLTLPIPARESRRYCSRSIDDPLVPCDAVCPSGGLTFTTGHAYVSSTTRSPCHRIAVDARQHFTRDAADDLVEASSQLTLVRFNGTNLGD